MEFEEFSLNLEIANQALMLLLYLIEKLRFSQLNSGRNFLSFIWNKVSWWIDHTLIAIYDK